VLISWWGKCELKDLHFALIPHKSQLFSLSKKNSIFRKNGGFSYCGDTTLRSIKSGGQWAMGYYQPTTGFSICPLPEPPLALCWTGQWGHFFLVASGSIPVT
jgi:hypothetical protein